MRRCAALLVPLALVLSGCGSADRAGPGAPAGTEGTDAGSAVLDASKCRDAASREAAPESCYAAYTPIQGPRVALGTGIEVADLDDPAARETMTVASVECGLAELPGVTPGADPGMTFCRVTATWQNTGETPLAGWQDFDVLVAADGTEHPADEKAAQATELLDACSPSACGPFAPGTPAIEVVQIYQVPEGTQPTAVRWARPPVRSGSPVEFVVQ